MTMSKFSLAGLVLLGGFVCAFALSEWLAARRRTSSQDRRPRSDIELLPHDTTLWERPRDTHRDSETERAPAEGER
jgi:hypothetical protein